MYWYKTSQLYDQKYSLVTKAIYGKNKIVKDAQETNPATWIGMPWDSGDMPLLINGILLKQQDIFIYNWCSYILSIVLI